MWNFFGSDITYDFEIEARVDRHNQIVSNHTTFGGLIEIREVFAVTLTHISAISYTRAPNKRTNEFGICSIRHRRTQLIQCNCRFNSIIFVFSSLINILS